MYRIITKVASATCASKSLLWQLPSPRYCLASLKVLCKALHNFFRAYKKKGFNLEDTHITEPERIRKLVALLSLALVWCYKAGVKYDACYEPIEVKKHGHKQYSFVKYGLDILRKMLDSLPLKRVEFANAVLLFIMKGYEKSLSEALAGST